jgi:hypothetical protein
LGGPPRHLGHTGARTISGERPRTRTTAGSRQRSRLLSGPSWLAAVHAPNYEPIRCHQAISTVLIFEHLAQSPRTASELAALMQASDRAVRRLLRRLEHDGMVEPVAAPRRGATAVARGRRPCTWCLADAGRVLGRQLAQAVPCPQSDALAG